MNSIFLFKLWIFNIDFSTVISFLLGILMGIIILFLIYALVVVSSIRTKDFIAKTEKDDLTTQEVKQMVEDTQKSFKDKTLRGDLGRVVHCERLCKDLALGIAVRYYPESKHPFLELSINELTMLTTYVTKRVDELLNHKGIRMLRKIKISTIVDLTAKKKQIEDSKAFQTTVSIGSKLSKVKYVLNFINPLNWGRKLIVDNVMNIIINQICLVVIAIVGEETYKIYSKKVFHKEVEIDTGSDELIETISQSIKTAAQQMDDGVISLDPAMDGYKLKGRIISYPIQPLEVYCTFLQAEPVKKKKTLEELQKESVYEEEKN